MNPNEILDEFLRFLYFSDVLKKLDISPTSFTAKQIYSNYNELMKNKFLNDEAVFGHKHEHEVVEILEKLSKDGYLKETKYQVGSCYATTFEGKWFISQGGYVGKFAALDAEKRKDEFFVSQSLRNGRMLNLLTVLLAFGTLIAAWYYGIEIWKYYHPSCH